MEQQTTQPAIRLENLSRKFGELQAVRSLNLSIEPGEIFGLVGPDGAGKTTVLRLICGLMDPTEGSVIVGGLDVKQHPERVRDKIGYMAQRFGLYADLTVRENMHFYADLFGLPVERREQLSIELLRMTRMEPFQGRRAGQLSGGMKQKLALMCSLLHEPEILILDEPTNGVDPISRRDFWVILYELVKRGLTVVLSTAYLDEAERCNRVGLFYSGELVLCDTPNRLARTLREECFELTSSDNRRARTLLGQEEGVLSIEPCGTTLHLLCLPESGLIERYEDLLKSEGVGGVKIRPIRPSVEDVFIGLIRKRTREVA